MKLIFRGGPFDGKSKEVTMDPLFPKIFVEVGKGKNLYQFSHRTTYNKVVLSLIYNYIPEAQWQETQKK